MSTEQQQQLRLSFFGTGKNNTRAKQAAQKKIEQWEKDHPNYTTTYGDPTFAPHYSGASQIQCVIIVTYTTKTTSE
jgi:hypothetical protein